MGGKKIPPLEADRGIEFLMMFTVAALTIVAGVWLTSATDAWWVLVLVVIVDLTLTALVTLGVFRLLDH